jgi:chemotaxis protein MotB
MSVPRGRRRPHAEAEVEDDVPDERWMASYMDMVTVLMCMFIVLFAMSTVDQNKFEQLANSLATGFGAVNVGSIDTAEGVVVHEDLVDLSEEGFTDAELAALEMQDFTELKMDILSRLEAVGLADTAQFVVNERGLTVGLVGSETFFMPDSADLSEVAVTVIDAMAPSLVAAGLEISVEGHADRHGQSVNYDTDWELSAGRAARVLRRLVEQGSVPQESILAVGFGSARPITTGDTISDQAQNRRVDVVVLSDQSDVVRDLMPEVVG